jgi:anti-anti-sigma regulatory factor
MIVSTKDDMVRLEGRLLKNHWATIRAAANLLLENYPSGIIIDCSALEEVSEEGAKTFLEAIKDIQAAGSRIVMAALPKEVLDVCRTVPGVRSAMPIAATVEEARASLRLDTEAASGATDVAAAAGAILVPLMVGLDVDYAVTIAASVAREVRSRVHLVGLLTVARNQPLTAPLPEAEARLNEMIEAGTKSARSHGVNASVHVERVRDTVEGLLQVVRTHHASHLVISLPWDLLARNELMDMVLALLDRAPCDVIIGRQAGCGAPTDADRE